MESHRSFPVLFPQQHSQDFFNFHSATDFLFNQQAFSCGSCDSSTEEFVSDIFSPMTLHSSDDDAEEDNSLQSIQSFRAKPPPPSYLEHLLLNEPSDYYMEHIAFPTKDCHSLDDHLGKWTPILDSRNFQMENFICDSHHPITSEYTIPSYFSPPPTPHNWQTSQCPAGQGHSSFTAEEEFYFFPSSDHQKGLLPSNTTCTDIPYIPASNQDSTEQRDSATWVVNHMTSEFERNFK